MQETFCKPHSLQPWPVTNEILEEWSANHIYGSISPKQGQIKLDTVATYLSGLRSYHINHHLPIEVFNGPRLAWIIKGGSRLFLSSKAKRLPITKDILKKITSTTPKTCEELNIDTAFKVARAGFLRLGEITYTAAELKNTGI